MSKHVCMQRFEIHLAKIKSLLRQANDHENSGLWLYLNDLRTPLFQVEALARLYKNHHNSDAFNKTYEQVKNLEDALGKVDYYLSLQLGWSENTTIPKEVMQTLQLKINHSLSELDSILLSEKWLNGSRVDKIEKRLADVAWPRQDEDRKCFVDFIADGCDFAKEFIYKHSPFTIMEDHVHELRRRLRWIGIIAQVSDGLIQLGVNEKVEERFKKYYIDAIVNSPYNIMSPLRSGLKPIELDRAAFFALSYTIRQLGIIKDQGLQIEELKDILIKTLNIKEELAYKKAAEYLNLQNTEIPQLLHDATLLISDFIDDEVLDQLKQNLIL